MESMMVEVKEKNKLRNYTLDNYYIDQQKENMTEMSLDGCRVWRVEKKKKFPVYFCQNKA